MWIWEVLLNNTRSFFWYLLNFINNSNTLSTSTRRLKIRIWPINHLFFLDLALGNLFKNLRALLSICDFCFQIHFLIKHNRKEAQKSLEQSCTHSYRKQLERDRDFGTIYLCGQFETNLGNDLTSKCLRFIMCNFSFVNSFNLLFDILLLI